MATDDVNDEGKDNFADDVSGLGACDKPGNATAPDRARVPIQTVGRCMRGCKRVRDVRGCARVCERAYERVCDGLLYDV